MATAVTPPRRVLLPQSRTPRARPLRQAHSVHVHAFDDAGRETLAGAACAKVVRAIRAACPETPISVTTSAAIVADPTERSKLVEQWQVMPDSVTANQGETGILGLC